MEGISSWIDENYGSASKKKTVSYRFFCLCIAFTSVWMFLLGMSVGRNTCPIRFDTKPIMSQISQWIESDVNQQQEYARMINSQDKIAEIDYEALKETNVELIPAQEKRQNPLENSTQKQLITKRSTKKRTKGQFTLKSDKDLSDCVTLQTASLKNAHAAVEMAKRLKRMGFPAYTASINIPQKGLWHRVRVGTFSSIQKARKMKDILQKQDINSIIVPFVRDDYNFAKAKDQIAYPES
jgi:hypothetical protein